MYVKVNTDVMSAQQKQIAEYINNYNTGIMNTKNTINNMFTAWQGNDYWFFKEKVNAFMEELLKLEKSLNQYSEFLEGYSSAMDKLDDYYSNKKIEIK